MISPKTFREHRSVYPAMVDKQLIWVLSSAVILIVGIIVCQDFLESRRSGYSFYLSESILFNTVWFLFIPILSGLHRMLKSRNLSSWFQTLLFIIGPVIFHIIILPFVVLIFSLIFFEGRYGLYKVFTYTLANDFYKLVLIYVIFVLVHRHLYVSPSAKSGLTCKRYLENVLIRNGKENTSVNVNDIFYVTSATPYICIKLEDKQYLQTETLKSLGDQLDQDRFVRVHKSAIVNLSKVVSFKSRLNGDYDLLLKNGDSVRLSRTYAAPFKKLFRTDHQVDL